MREGVWHNVALRLSLQSVVPDCRRCLQRGFDITRFNEMPFRLGTIRPNTGQTIGLQLYTDLQAIGFNLAHCVLRLLHLRQHAKQVLHVMTDLVSDHVGL